MQAKTRQATEAFARDVREGLTRFPKSLPSRYIYDARGDALFQKIMEMPEYYLTGCETAILNRHKSDIAARFCERGSPFDLVELGAGDGKKTRILLRELLEENRSFRYMPVDISGSALQSLAGKLGEELPELEMKPWQGTYFEVLRQLDQMKDRHKVILFMGSNIGNLLHPQAVDFLTRLRRALSGGDQLLIGFDQKKDPATILAAYNDPAGITAAFNKNVLERINRELGGEFDTEKFRHWEVYDPESGTAKSYLVAQEDMQVRIGALHLEVALKQWETIHTEISQKYDDEVVRWLAGEAGLEVVDQYADPKGYYKNYLFRRAKNARD
ncbi:L-histidine N(alpha)-methyltransferase [Robiginitalea sp. SC105]|uniref:L-histidine N(alpha)-methyltransferase n=1 Tax=Robiginitalea sp. SC105 TaxID=2762332 RepID=UPI00163AE6CD|nr:L-histidine N(alpha)-methyltransferase [Robiginitalea sp. SC105]MBC2838914.1 L-histidine N(alpha)-methyltransferase [Robiginitalea sp. SC105]